MGNARARGTYAERKAQAIERLGLSSAVGFSTSAPPSRRLSPLAAIERVFRKVKDKDGTEQTRLVERRQKQGLITSADGRSQYRYDGVSLRRIDGGGEVQ